MHATGQLFRTLVNVGYPLALLVIVARDTDMLKKLYGKEVKITDIPKLVEELNPIDVRLKLTFDPIHFNNPYSWSEWGYPLKTLLEEIELDKLNKYKVKILPPNDYREYASYFGFALVSGNGKVYGYAVLEPKIPRKIVVLIPEGNTIHAYTGLKSIGELLVGLGYRHVKDGEYVIATNNVYHELLRTERAIKSRNMLVHVFMPREYSRVLREAYT